MNDAQKTVNLLEGIELLLKAVRLELELARIDHSEEQIGNRDRNEVIAELDAALDAFDKKRPGSGVTLSQK